METNNLVLKTIYFFQIIELEYPNRKDTDSYPEYNESAPKPRTECKLLRDFVAHAGDKVGPDLKKYCSYLNIRESMFDHSDAEHLLILKQ